MKPSIYGPAGIIILALSVFLAAPGQVIGAQNQEKATLPDFTEGDVIPDGANHDWNLGATGLRGWIYGDHVPWIQTHETNGKNGMAAVMFNLLGDAQAAEYFSRMAIASHGNERDYGHAGNIWNILWSMPGVVQSGPNAAGAWMREFGAWYFDLARESDGTFG